MAMTQYTLSGNTLSQRFLSQRTVSQRNANYNILYYNLALWYRMDNVLLSGSNITQFNDKSKEQEDAEQTTSIYQPTIVYDANGYPSAIFDGSDDYMLVNRSWQDELTVYVVVKRSASGLNQLIINNDNSSTLGGGLQIRFLTNNKIRFYNGTASNYVDSSIVFNLDQYYLITCVSDTHNRLYINGTADNTTLRDAAYTRNEKPTTRIGDSELFSGYHLNGGIAEMSIYFEAHNDIKRNYIENYLKSRYNL